MASTSVYLRGSNRVTVAQMCGRDAVMDEAAHQVLRAVKRFAAQSVDTGNYISKLGVKKVPGEKGTGVTVMDRLVVADDDAAASIEWGHLVRYKNSRRVRWVPGKHYMRNGLAQVKSIE